VIIFVFYFIRLLTKTYIFGQNKSPVWQAVSMTRYHLWKILTQFWQILVMTWN